MILKKAIIDGKEVFIPISLEEAYKVEKKEDLVFTDEDEKEVVEAYGFRFHILEVTGNVIRKVEIIQIKQENNEEERQKDE